ncbi:MAG: hypothetical protein KJ571_11100 [Bacteroidetes bacterium]|nr:hypothetical protein [Bacteroidota bacterium]
MTKQKKAALNKPLKKKTPKLFYIILFLLPAVFLILIEITLLLFDYGDNPEEWVSLSNDIEILNPDISKRYFSGINNPPFSTESFLLKHKPDNSFRVIVLGASSGAGYPYQNSASFSKYIRKYLRLSYPDNTIEVANVSMAAVNSYTMLDLLPGIIEKKPDLILIYLGHNEYYGALGAGSAQSFVSSRLLTKFVLKINEFRTVQFIKNILMKISGSMIKSGGTDDGTLMAQVASEKLIELNSEIYAKGLDQFEGNMRDIFSICKEAGVNVIIGTLASNVKDQAPFNPVKNSSFPPADKVYDSALIAMNKSDYPAADSLFTYAKDLDGLRFRAPEKINEIITTLAKEYGFISADIKKEMKLKSLNNIIGNDLMTDHLHPNIHGYQIIGKSFLKEMLKNGFLPDGKITSRNLDSIDAEIKLNYNFTKFDSTISDFRIRILKNDWPYKTGGQRLPKSRILNSKTFEDKTAIDVLDNKISRRDARLKLAEYYLNEKNYILYADVIIQLCDEFPTTNDFANKTAAKLISLKEYALAEKVLQSGYYINKDMFNTKWLGIINLSKNNFALSIYHLELSMSFDANDPQVLFNLAAAYSGIKNFNKALEIVNQCLKISPNYANAADIKTQLEKIINK